MSGIVGTYRLDGRPIAPETVQRMTDILAHRGPDGSDVWISQSVGLGHRMLWTTPESLLEKLPLADESEEFVITSDARIDNREELISELHFDNLPSEKITDSQIILAAYNKWGEECPQYLLGDFAFAIWDKLKSILFCARDHFGVKPFYYYYKPNQFFAFGSEIKALLCLPQVPQQLNEVRIGDFLAVMMEDKSITTYQDILRLPPAHSMVVSQSGISLRCYWALDPHREIKMDSDEAYAQEFRKIFTEAVRCRLRSAFPIASHLSGGLDSSAITCVARNLLLEERKTKLHTISNIFDTVKECDERQFINSVLDQGGVEAHYVHADEFGPLSDVDEIWQYEDEALLGPSHAYPWMLNKAAKQIGARVVLDGLDGDTTVCHGVPRLREIARKGEWKHFLQEAAAVAKNYEVSVFSLFKSYGVPEVQAQARGLRWVSFTTGINQIHESFGIPYRKLLLNYGIKSFIPSSLKQFWHRKQKLTKSKTESLLNRDFAGRIGLDERIKMSQSPHEASTTREYHWRGLTAGIFPYINEQLDRYAIPFSLEVRHPFLDKRLVEFCLALPADQKLNQGWGRIVMRRALEDIFPKAVQWRGGKTSMTPNFVHGMLKVNGELLDKVMCDDLDLIKPYIEADRVQAAYDRMKSGLKESDNDNVTVWRAAILAMWFRRKQQLL